MIVNGTASHFLTFLQCATEGTVMKISLKSISVGVALSTLSVAAMAADPIVGTWQTYEDNQPKPKFKSHKQVLLSPVKSLRVILKSKIFCW